MAGERRKAAADAPVILDKNVPEWANSAAIAQLLGKHVRSVQGYTQQGVLETEVPPGGGARKYRTCETVQRYIAHVVDETRLEAAEGDRKSELTVKKLEAEIALKESQGKLHMLKTDIEEGKYIPAERARAELSRFLGVFKKFAAALPARMAGALAGYADPVAVREIEQTMVQEVKAMLAAFVDAGQPEAHSTGAADIRRRATQTARRKETATDEEDV